MHTAVVDRSTRASACCGHYWELLCEYCVVPVLRGAQTTRQNEAGWWPILTGLRRPTHLLPFTISRAHAAPTKGKIINTFVHRTTRSFAALALAATVGGTVLTSSTVQAASRGPVTCLGCNVPQPGEPRVPHRHCVAPIDLCRWLPFPYGRTTGLSVCLSIRGGAKTLLGSAERTPTTDTPYTVAWDSAQPQDPCTAGASLVEVDAFVSNLSVPRTLGRASATLARLPLAATAAWSEIATATTAVNCGQIIY